MSAFPFLFGRLSPAGRGARLTILIFHRVLAEADALLPTEPDQARFEAQMRWVKAWFNVLPLAEAVHRLRAGTLPARPLAITFDDGYADNFDVALPILSRLGLTATFFIAAGYLDGGRMFNDTVIEAVRAYRGEELDLSDLQLGRHLTRSLAERQATIDRLLRAVKYSPDAERRAKAEAIADRAGAPAAADLMMTSDQVAMLHRSGMTVGAHTVSHPILANLQPEAATREIADGKARLEAMIGAPVTLFAYPNGKPGEDYSGTHVQMVRELGFEGAVSTAPGVASSQSDVLQLPRFTPWDRSALKYGLRLARNLTHTIGASG